MTTTAPTFDDVRLAGWQVLYEQRSFWRNRTRAFFAVGFPMVFLVVFAALNNGAKLDDHGGVSYNTFFLPGILSYAVVMATFTNLAVETARLREMGMLKRVRATPLPAWTYLAGRIGSAVIVALLTTLVTIVLGATAYGVHLRAEAVPGLLAALALGTAAFAALGIGIVRIIPNADAAPVVVNVVLLPLTFISGVWGPNDGEPAFLAHLAHAFPVQPMADWLQRCFDPRMHGATLVGADAKVLAIWLVIGAVMTKRFLRGTMEG
jgi:ABC-2 type transport system permease protein